MPYTIGAAHGPFTGNGSFAISKPAGIRSILTGIPSWTGHDGNTPRRYFKLGRMSLGNAHGFQFSHGLEYAQQLLYPVAPVWEILAYDIKDGASCTFWELVDVPDLSLKQPWDRTPSPWNLSSLPGSTGAVPATTAFTYTVPVGRRLLLGQMTAWGRRTNVATTVGSSGLWMTINGTVQGYRDTSSNVPQFELRSELSVAGLILNPGAVLTGNYSTTDIGGNWQWGFTGNGTLFDA